MNLLVKIVAFILLSTSIGQIHVVCGLFCVSRYLPKSSGFCIKASQCTGAALPELCTNNPGTVCCIPDPNEGDTVIVKNRYVSRTTFYDIFGKTRRSTSLYPYYIKALDDAGISTPEQIAAFTAQILYETSNLTLTEEDSDGLQYEGSASLGNNQPGDGPLYRGRGIIPIRGRHMYKVLAYGISQDLEDAPESAAVPSIAFKIAAWLWNNGYQSADSSSPNTGPLRRFVSNTTFDFAMMSYAIFKWQNAKIKAMARFPFWMKAIKILNATCPSSGQGQECTANERQGVCKLASECKGRSVENLCDGPADVECCVECNNPVDLVFVVDSSGSVGRVNFKLAMEFVANVSMGFDVSFSKDGTQVALIRFATKSEIIFNFKKFISNNALRQALMTVAYEKGLTRTVLALDMALNDLFRNTTSGVRSKRLGVSRILVLLTDGKSDGSVDSVRQPSDALRKEGVNIFSIGIGKRLRMEELEAIASDPDEDHVFLSNSFDAVQKLVKTIQLASCNEPALLESVATTEITIQPKTNKFFKYQNNELEEITWLIVSPVKGLVDVQPSLTDRNPLKDSLQVCGSKDIIITERSKLRTFLNASYCTSSPQGGIVIPYHVNRRRKTKIACVKMCSYQNIYVGVKGLMAKNMFNISLLNYSDADINIEELFASEMNNSSTKDDISWPTFPLETQVYVGSILAATGTMATVVAYVTVSCAGQTVELKCSSKIKRKKKKEQDTESGASKSNENNSATNRINHQASSSSPNSRRLVRQSNVTSSMINAIEPRTSSTTELLPSNHFTNEAQEKEELDRAAIKAVDWNNDSYEIQNVQSKCDQNPKTAPLTTNYASNPRKIQTERQMRKAERLTPRTLMRPPKVKSPKSINSKQEKNHFPLKRKAAETKTNHANSKHSMTSKGSAGNSKDNEMTCPPFKGTRLKPIKEQNKIHITRNDPVPNPQLENRHLFLNDDVFYEHSEVLPNKSLQKANESRLSENPGRLSSLKHREPSSDVEHLILNSQPDNQHPSQTTFQEFQSTILCCDTSSSKQEEANAQCGNKVNEKRLKKFHLRKDQVFQVVCPCFTVFIADDEGISEKEAAELRERRFERNMHLSQASCVLLTQLIFMVGIHARDNEIACTAAAISMNYLYLVAMVWLLVEAYYLYQITRDDNQHNHDSAKSKRKYYLFAWVLPAVVVLFMAIRSRQYNTNPHCWVSMTDYVDIAVSLPFVTVGLVQLILFGLMFKVLLTYRKTKNNEDKNLKKEILKTGLRNVLCITLTVLMSWLLGTVSMNIDRHMYQTAFTVWNTLQGFSFLLFHVLLNEETREIILTIISYLKKGAVSPMEEHEHVEVEQEKEKNKDKKNQNQRQVTHQSDIGQDLATITEHTISVTAKEEVDPSQDGQRQPHSQSLPQAANATTNRTNTKRGKSVFKSTTQAASKASPSSKTTGVTPKSLKMATSVTPNKNIRGVSQRKESIERKQKKKNY